MKIDQVYITTSRHHIRCPRCCVASIRHWHPDVPIALLKDQIDGPYSIREIESH